uniref:Uncharacterized protein n=1 Tax=Romanomermis culicivorax TaxID=13658 RepID=A0A915K8E0_ROMCU
MISNRTNLEKTGIAILIKGIFKTRFLNDDARSLLGEEATLFDEVNVKDSIILVGVDSPEMGDELE